MTKESFTQASTESSVNSASHMNARRLGFRRIGVLAGVVAVSCFELTPDSAEEQAEVSAAVLPAADATACPSGGAQPEVFVTYESSKVMHGPLNCAGQSAGCFTVNTSLPVPNFVSNPNSPTCSGSSVYSPTGFTDSVIARLPGGRIILVGLVRRLCNGVQIESALLVRISKDCGANWQAQAIDASSVNIPTGATWVDRPDVFVDPYSDNVFITANFARVPPATPARRLVILATSKGGPTATTLGPWTPVFNRAPGPGLPTPPVVASMTSVLVTNPAGQTTSRAVAYYCVPTNSAATQGTPTIAFDNGGTITELAIGPAGSCGGVGHAGGLWNVMPGGTIAAFGEAVPPVNPSAATAPFLRAAFTTTINGFQALRIARIAMTWSGSTLSPQVTQQEFLVDKSTSSTHILWPNFTATDTLGGSPAGNEAAVLRWAEVAGDTVTELAQTHFRSAPPGAPGGQATWSPSTAFGRACGTTDQTACKAGDYRYSAYVDTPAAGSNRFFLLWSSDAAPAGPAMHAFGLPLTVATP